jgi:4-hydroxy-tetrahydrodipicolinate synthase
VFEGVFTALVTPFRDGEVDEPALRELVELQVAAGVDGVAPCGSTGEAATLSHAEHGRVVQVVVEAARRRIQVLAGTGSNNTRESIELTRHARRVGADGALLISPYYNKPTGRDVAHYTASRAERASAGRLQHPRRTASTYCPRRWRLADVEQSWA